MTNRNTLNIDRNKTETHLRDLLNLMENKMFLIL